MYLELSEYLRDGCAVAELRGELDVSKAPTLRQQLLGILAERGPSLILDLSGLAFIDSTGLGVLVAAGKRADQADGTLSLAGPQKTVARVLHITRLDDHFPIFPTVEDALAARRVNDPPPAAK